MKDPAVFPAERSILRSFILTDQRGSKIDLSRFRQQRNLVLFFLNYVNHATEKLLQELGEKQTRLKEEEAVVLAVLHGDREQSRQLRKRLQIPFSMLTDEAGEIVTSFAGGGVAVYITDRFREVFAHCHDDRIFSRDEVLEWLAHINRQCPE